jgi:intracellular multiplication protein IcmL
MFKKFLQALDNQPNDSIAERIEKEAISAKYWFNLGGAIFLSLATIVIGTYVLIQRKKHIPPQTNAINVTKNTIEQIQTLPFPHQSFKNISGWLNEAIAASYAFDFNHIEEQISDAEYYYTPTGYSMYLKAIESTHIKDEVLNKKLQIALVPIQDPILINSGTVGDTEFWRFRVPILTSYYAGKDPLIQKNMVEVLIIRVPAYKNQKGLAITEFNMSGM